MKAEVLVIAMILQIRISEQKTRRAPSIFIFPKRFALNMSSLHVTENDVADTSQMNDFPECLAVTVDKEYQHLQKVLRDFHSTKTWKENNLYLTKNTTK